MALFGFGKKRKEEKTPPCSCQCSCSASAEAEQTSCCSGQGAAIQVLGTGCASCHALLENTQEAVRSLGLNVQVEYVQDMATIVGYGVMSLPALVVHGKVVSTGKVLKPAQIEALLQDGAK